MARLLLHLLVGVGVGCGLVLDGEVYYGTHERAGEVGHVTLQLEDHLSIIWVELPKRLCSCGKRAFHFETLVGLGGLGHLAVSFDEQKLAEIRAKLDGPAPSDQYSGSEKSIDAYDAAGMYVLRAFSERLHFAGEFEGYLQRVMDAYAKMFGVGVAALIDVLDIGRVALCGAIPEFIKNSGELRRSYPRSRGGPR